jgi:hypothetical protein
MGLTPLLLSIGETAGKTGAGHQYVDTFKRQMAPDLNTDDSNSIMDYVEWARRNGYDDEAQQYLALGYKQKEKEAQEAKDAALGKTMAEATQASASGRQLGSTGDLGGADATIESLRKRLSNPDIQKNPLAVRAIQEEIGRLQSSRPDFVAKNTQVIAQGVAKMDQNIAALSKDDPQYDIKKAKLLEARDRFLQQPNVAEAYETNKLKMMELNNQQAEAMWKNQRSAITQEIANAGTDINKIKMIEEKYPQFAAEIQSIKGPMINQAIDIENVLSDQFDMDQLPSRIQSERERVKSSAMSETEKNNAYKLLDGVQTRYDRGKASGAIQGAKTQLASVMANINGVLNNANSAEAGVDRQRTERAVIRAEGAKQAAQKGPEPKDVIALVESKSGQTWDDLNKDPKEAEELYDEMKAELMVPLLEYWERAEIDAGNEPYKEIDMEDVRTIKSEYKEISDRDASAGIKTEKYEVYIQRKAYELAAQGYEKDAVTKLLSKETTMSLTDANNYYDTIMADIEVNDDRIADLVRQSLENPSSNESIASIVYEETVLKRARGNRVVNPNLVSDDHATRTRRLLSDPNNLYQGVTLSPFENKLADAYAEANAGRGFKYPSLSELQPTNPNNRVR